MTLTPAAYPDQPGPLSFNMDKPGNSLKTERERQNKSLTAIEKSLNIQIEYLEAIEKDDYEVLPSEFFLKAYLRLYADTLGIDHNDILKLYEDYRKDHNIQSSNIKTPFRKPSLPGFLNLFARGTTGKIILAIFITVVLAALIAFSVSYIKQEPPLNTEQTTPAPVINAKTDKLSLNIAALNLTWVSVKADDLKPKEWLLRPGETITLSAQDKFVIKVGNAGGTKLTLNGRDVGVLGPHGKVVDIELP